MVMNNLTKKTTQGHETILKKILISTFAIATLLILVFFILIGIENSKKVHIAFYAIPESIEQPLQTHIDSWFIKNSSKRKPAYHFFSAEQALGEIRLKNTSLIITYNGKNLDTAQKQELSPELYKNIPSSLCKASLKDSKPYFLPLLIDHFELLSHTQTSVKMESYTNLSFYDFLDIATDVSKKTNKPSIYIAAKSDSQLLQFVGALQEVLTGTPPKDSASHSVSEAINLLKEMQKDNIIHSTWYNLTEQDIVYYMSNEDAPFVFIPLSEHRKLSYNITKKYRSFFVASIKTNQSRTLTAPLISAFIPTKTSSKNKLIAESLLSYLITPPVQARLSTTTGLAPADANANTPDIEADDLRYWVAASSQPYPGLDKAAFVTLKEQKTAANILRNELRK